MPNPSTFHTEYGVDAMGHISAVEDWETAHRMQRNFHEAGHVAEIVWRAVSDWMPFSDD